MFAGKRSWSLRVLLLMVAAFTVPACDGGGGGGDSTPNPSPPMSLTARVSVDSVGAEANGNSYYHAISSDGRYVAFASGASNLVVGDTNGGYDIFVRDTVGGTTTRVSVDSVGAQANGFSYYPAISSDGRYVAFYSIASNLVVGDTNSRSDIFVRGPGF
jgi:Tol biopolymer transport system component